MPVEPDVGNTDQGHVALEGDGISHPLPDDAVAIDSHPNMLGVHVMSSVLVCLQHRLPLHPVLLLPVGWNVKSCRQVDLTWSEALVVETVLDGGAVIGVWGVMEVWTSAVVALE